VFAVWITVGHFEVVERQSRLPRAEVHRASDGELRAVLFGVELVRSDPAGDPPRSDRRRYLVRYQRLEAPATPKAGERTRYENRIELISVHGSGGSVRARVVEGDLLARVGDGRAGGPGQIHLEGDQALVFFLGGLPARRQPIPEIRARTAEGRTFVLQGVRVETLESPGGTARARLLYQGLLVP
jgi:hypothetical protein